jgi:D-serine deaminase-like pyridoxal phosphate-dependent protein
LETPFLLLQPETMEANIARMNRQMERLGLALRPHVKTAKCAEVVRAMQPEGPLTVSTLAEARACLELGYRDFSYAVGFSASKFASVADLLDRGGQLFLILDHERSASLLIQRAQSSGKSLAILLEIDCDGARAGLQPDDPALIPLAERLSKAGHRVMGVLTHCGGSYLCRGQVELSEAAERERQAVVLAAQRLRSAGFACPVVSAGSTPTALFSQSGEGLSEMRAGVYVFMDLVMAGLGVCALSDIALSVVAEVIGVQADKGWTLVDAGWTALSRDRGTAGQALDQGYGLVCDMEGQAIEDLVVAQVNQEHGILCDRSGRGRILEPGSRVRILPNHACACAASFAGYHVPLGKGDLTYWPRFATR